MRLIGQHGALPADELARVEPSQTFICQMNERAAFSHAALEMNTAGVMSEH